MPDEISRWIPVPPAGGHTLRQTNWRMIGMSVAVVTLGALAVLGAPESASAQQADQPRPRISVAPTIIATPASQVLLMIQVGPPAALPKKSFVSLRGLPPSVSLTEGYVIGPGSWAVPLFALPTLKANIPAGASGRSEIIISLIAMEGPLLAEARTALVVGPAAMLPPMKEAPAVVSPPGPAELPSAKQAPAEPPRNSQSFDASSSPGPAAQPGSNAQTELPPSTISAEEKARAERLVAQGEKNLADGKIEVARQFFERAAEAGLAVAALRLAASYDPGELARLQALGIVPDRAQARKWYERARELGAPEAEARLAKLGGS